MLRMFTNLPQAATDSMRTEDEYRIVGEVTPSLEGEVGLREKKVLLVEACIGSSIRGAFKTV